VRLARIRDTLTERDFDVVRTMRYRSELFGRPFSSLLQQVMRGPSDWSPGERELFAAFVSAQNQCVF
jgi:hypothetical protein